MTTSFRNPSTNAFGRYAFGAAIAAGLAATLAIAAPAAAKDVRVTYSDLNLASPAGQAELNKRIERAAGEACAAGPVTGTRVAPTSRIRKCIADAKKEIGATIAQRTGESALGG